MVNFNNLTEGEKLAFSKEFLIKFKVIKNLKPSLTEERDILLLVANKFYDGDLRVLEDCIRYMYSKHEFDSLDNVDLQEAAESYAKEIAKAETAKSDELKKKEAETQKKEGDYQKAVKKRNDAASEYDQIEHREKAKKNLKFALITALVLFGCGLLIAYGGIVGVVNVLLGAITELSFAQLGTIGLVGWWGIYKGGFKEIWGKIKGPIDTAKDKKKEKANAIKAQKEGAEKARKDLEGELSTLRSQVAGLKRDCEAQSEKTQAELANLERYDGLAGFERKLALNEIAIKEQYNLAKEHMTSEEDLQRLDDWHRQYIGSLYFGAYNGDIRTPADFDLVRADATRKFNQLLDPLYINTDYNPDNVRAGREARTNRPLEELYQTI